MEELLRLYEDWRGCAPQSVEQLPGAGSNRTYYRFRDAEGDSLIGVVGTSREENEAFIYLAGHFGQKRLPMPRVVAVSTSRLCYLQTDLGHRSLFDVLSEGREKGGRYAPEEKELLRRTIAELPRIQFVGAEGLDFGRCYPMASMDRTAVFFDLNYFKYCFLKTTGLDFNEVKLEEAFSEMAKDLVGDPDRHAFQYRDFQARNVMLDRDGQPRFIDFQGGRRGPVEYDVASFLWQASAHYAPELRHELMATYLDAARLYTDVDEGRFRERMRLFVLFRTLQVLGAYGFRGYFERKKHFLDSIAPAIRNLREWLSEGECPYPYLYDVLSRMVDLPLSGQKFPHSRTNRAERIREWSVQPMCSVRTSGRFRFPDTMAGGRWSCACSVSPIRRGFPKTLVGTEAVMCSIAAVRTIPEDMNRTKP